MRRPTKATTSSSRNGTTTAAFNTGYENLPPSSSTSSSHLELSSANADDNEITSKIHKKKNIKQRYQKGSSIAIAAVCSLIAFGTLYFVAKYVSSMISTKSRSTGSIHHPQRKTILAENNNVIDADKYNHHHHHTNQLPPDSIYRAKVTDIHGTLQDLHQYAGSISLIVNVACE